MLNELVIGKAFDVLFDMLKKILFGTGFKLISSKGDLEDSITYHITEVKNWSNAISFNDIKKAKLLADIYVDLDLLLYPIRNKMTLDEKIEEVSFEEIFMNIKNHIVLLGQPGAGKTTSMKHICQCLFLNEDRNLKINFPVVVKLRELNLFDKTEYNNNNTCGPLIEKLFEILGLRIGFDKKGKNELDVLKNLDGIATDEIVKLRMIKEKLVVRVLNDLQALIIFDGFDEISLAKTKTQVVEDLRLLANKLEKSYIIFTSRTSDFVYSIDNISQFEIAPLSELQINTFAQKWTSNIHKALDFLDAIKSSPFSDTAMRPLNLAHLCAIYERIGKIPEKPKTVYKKIINLLLEEWDEQRSIRRNSKYANFEVDRKFEFLSNLAFVLTTDRKTSVFSVGDLERGYKKIYLNYSLKRDEMKKVVKELETHTGLFVQAGYEYYEFAHKSLQEYLSAEYIVKLPSLPKNIRMLTRLPNEIAIAIAISSNPSLYFVEFITQRLLEMKFSFNFIRVFINRLILEKPDFHASESVVISSLILYTVYINLFRKNNDQLSLFLSDPLIKEFEKFLQLIFKVNRKDSVLKFYELHERQKTDDNKVLNVLSIKEDIKSDVWPQYLYTRDSFLKL